MGAFNTLKVLAKCIFCKKKTEFSIQFKYGDTWCYEYKLGDRLRWGGNDIGIKGAKRVVLDGESKPCMHCGKEINHIIHIMWDVIQGIEENTGQYDFNSSEGYYIVIEE